MLKFRNKSTVPPGNMYFYYCSETESRFENGVLFNLVIAVREHLSVNELDVPENLEEIIVDQMCHDLPRGFCYGWTDRKRRLVLTSSMVRDFTKVAFGVSRLHDDAFVHEKEAERRAAICVNCPENDTTLCMTCRGLKAIALKLIGRKRKTLLDRRMGTCRICKCALGAKVWVVDSILDKLTEHDYPTGCWMHKKKKEVPF